MKKAMTIGTFRFLEPFLNEGAAIAKSIEQISEFAFLLGRNKRLFQSLQVGATQ